MQNYQELLTRIFIEGDERQTRRGPTIALFGERLEFDLSKSFPAVTTKKLYFDSVAGELAGFLRAEQDARNMGSRIWLSDARRWWEQPNSLSENEFDIGRVYGVQWRKWGNFIDQLGTVVTGLMTDPNERYHLVTAWNPVDRQIMCLEPCHYAFQFFVKQKRLSCMFQMRSVDTFLGLPFNIASYALLTHIIANECGYVVGKLIASLGDTHLYKNHLPQVATLLSREPYPGPYLILNPKASIDNFTADMAKLGNYRHHPLIEAVMNNEQVG